MRVTYWVSAGDVGPHSCEAGGVPVAGSSGPCRRVTHVATHVGGLPTVDGPVPA